MSTVSTLGDQYAFEQCRAVAPSYAAAHDAGMCDTLNFNDVARVQNKNDGAGNYYVTRGFLSINLHSMGLPSGGFTISSSSIALTMVGNVAVNNDAPFSSSTAFYAYTGTSTASFLLSDHNNCGTAPLTDAFLTSEFVNGAYTYHSFNAAGLAYLSVATSSVRFCLRNIGDVNGDVPAGDNQVWLANGNSGGSQPLVTLVWDTAGEASIASGTLRQFKSDGTTPINEGDTTTEDTVVFGATLNSSTTDQLRLEVEYTTSTFIGVPNATSSPVSPDSFATATARGLPDGYYHWRARVVNVSTAVAFPWQEFGTPGNTDVIVYTAPLPSDPAILAQQLDGSVRTGTQTGCNNACSNVTVGQQVFTTVRSGTLASLELFTADFNTQSLNPLSNGCSVRLFNQDTNTLIADADTGFNVPDCVGNPIFTFNNASVILHVGTHYRWDFVWVSQNFTSLSFLGSPRDTVNGVFSPAGPVVNAKFIARTSVRNINVAVILAEPSGTGHSTATATQPCKLLNQSTTYQGHTKAYFDDLMFCVKDYYRENFYGTINVSSTVYDNGGSWYQLATSTSYYVGREDEFARDATAKWQDVTGLATNSFDAIIAVHSSSSAQLTNNTSSFMVTLAANSIFSSTTTLPDKIIISEYDPLGAFVHELGHVFGDLVIPTSSTSSPTMPPDLYNMGLVDSTSSIEAVLDREGEWDVMARGVYNGNPTGSDPPQMSSYTKEFLKLLTYDSHAKSAYGIYPIEALEQKSAGDKVFRYNLAETTTTDDNITPYYILETRKSNLASTTWDSSIPEDALIAYYVNPLGFPAYGYATTTTGVYIQNQCRTINIPVGGVIIPGPFFSTFADFDTLTAFSFVSTTTNPKYIVNAAISHIDQNSLLFGARRYFVGILRPQENFNKTLCQLTAKGLLPPIMDRRLFLARTPPLSFPLVVSTKEFLRPIMVFVAATLAGIFLLFGFLSKRSEKFWQQLRLKRIFTLPIRRILAVLTIIPITIIWFIYLFIIMGWFYLMGWHYLKIGFFLQANKPHFTEIAKFSSVASPSLTPSVQPDLDLHAITPDGKHVGMNYATGEYENQIPGAIVSGNNQGSPEWILIPDGVQAKFYVSSYGNQAFLNANPDIAGQLATTTDSYDIYARYIDPDTGIFTSATSSAAIAPAQNMVYKTTGTSTISVSPGTLDNEPPTITHSAISAEYLLNSAPITFDFSADDGAGVGGATTTATLDGQPISPGSQISFTVPGQHAISIASSDFFGNATSTAINFSVVYQFGSFLPPIKADGSGIYKQGRTLPTKFQLTNASGSFISTAIASLFLAKVSDGIAGTEEVALSTLAADTGNQFRYDQTNNQYIFNLSLNLDIGTWRLKVALDDSKNYVVDVSVRQ